MVHSMNSSAFMTPPVVRNSFGKRNFQPPWSVAYKVEHKLRNSFGEPNFQSLWSVAYKVKHKLGSSGINQSRNMLVFTKAIDPWDPIALRMDKVYVSSFLEK